MKKFGLITITGGRKTGDGVIEFNVETFGERMDVVVEESDGEIIATLSDPPEGVDPAAAAIPVRFSVSIDGGYGARLTLPSPSDSGWEEREPDAEELQLAVGGVQKLITQAGGTVDGTEVRFMSGRAVPVVTCVATRALPFLTGHDLAAPPPWELTPPSPLGRHGHASGDRGRGDNGGSIVRRLDLHPKLLDALHDAIQETGAPRIEYGIIEHKFAYENPDDYRELHTYWGHRAVDPPLSYSISSYLAGRLADLKGTDVRYHGVQATGFWSYNSGISAWSALDVAPTSPLATWSDFAADHGWHPKEWRAGSLLWGKEPLVERAWSGYRGPGEARLLQRADVPESRSDDTFNDFVDRFDAPAAFGDDLTMIYERVRNKLTEGEWVPRDVGLLRGCLWAEHRVGPGDEFVTSELLRAIRMFTD